MSNKSEFYSSRQLRNNIRSRLDLSLFLLDTFLSPKIGAFESFLERISALCQSLDVISEKLDQFKLVETRDFIAVDIDQKEVLEEMRGTVLRSLIRCNVDFPLDSDKLVQVSKAARFLSENYFSFPELSYREGVKREFAARGHA